MLRSVACRPTQALLQAGRLVAARQAHAQIPAMLRGVQCLGKLQQLQPRAPLLSSLAMRRLLSSEAGSSTAVPADPAAAPASTAADGAPAPSPVPEASASTTSQGLLSPEEALGVVEAISMPTRFAVMIIGGTQYKIAPDDLIAVEKMELEVRTRAQRSRTHA